MLQGQISALQRSEGAAMVDFARVDGRVVLRDMAQRGSAKVMLPRSQTNRPEVVFVNTSGGLTSGDRLDFTVTLQGDAAAAATTQTAERAYLAKDGPARLGFHASLGVGGRLDWLPQETILFEDSDLIRSTTIALASGASCLLSEVVVLGRRAMGEAPQRARLLDRRMVTMGGRPLWAEALRLGPDVLADAGAPAVLGGHVAFAVLALLGAGAEQAAGPLRDLAAVAGVETAVSGWNGRCILRAKAPDLWILKQWLGPAIARLSNRPLPRVWQMQGVSA